METTISSLFKNPLLTQFIFVANVPLCNGMEELTMENCMRHPALNAAAMFDLLCKHQHGVSGAVLSNATQWPMLLSVECLMDFTCAVLLCLVQLLCWDQVWIEQLAWNVIHHHAIQDHAEHVQELARFDGRVIRVEDRACELPAQQGQQTCQQDDRLQQVKNT